MRQYVPTIVKHVALCAACGLLFLIVPPAGLGLAVIAVWWTSRNERAEFLYLLLLVAVFPVLGLLPWLITVVQGGPPFFLLLALFRDFFSWFRPDPNPAWSDTGPNITPTELHRMMVGAFVTATLAAIAYAWLLAKRFQQTRRNVF
ncbi:MAG: hypothetical protein ABI977_05590 [Acidobacteriota bacterium]